VKARNIVLAMLALMLMVSCDYDSCDYDGDGGGGYTGNDTFDTATPIELGTPARDRIEISGDVDWFKFTTTQAGVIEILVDSVAANIDMDVRVYEDREREIANSLGTGSGASVLLLFLREPGSYWLKLCDGHGRSSEYYYTLLVALDASDPYEMNNSRAEATPILLGSPVRAKIRPSGDEDWYKLTTSQTGVLEISVDSVASNIDMDVRVYDDREREIANSLGTGSGASVLLLLLREPGSYWLKLCDGHGRMSPYYYKLLVTIDVSDPYEINNSFTQATPILLGATVQAKIRPNGDLDYYKFTNPAAETIRTTVDTVPVNIDMDVYVYDDREREIARSTGTGEGQRVDFSVYLPTGVYYVRLGDGHGRSSSQYYLLKVAPLGRE
jgi:hypothetical protein